MTGAILSIVNAVEFDVAVLFARSIAFTRSFAVETFTDGTVHAYPPPSAGTWLLVRTVVSEKSPSAE